MTTSGVTTWPLTAREIIHAALDENAILDLDDDFSANEAEKCLLRLNALLKSSLTGAHLETFGTLTIPAGSASGTLPADVREVISARYVNASGAERMMNQFGRDDYLSLPNKAQSGVPFSYYVANQGAAPVMYVWPTPSVDTELRLDYMRMPETITDLDQTVDWPVEYAGALYAMLGVQIAGIFGEQSPPELIARAERLRREIEDADRPSSYYMVPACR